MKKNRPVLATKVDRDVLKLAQKTRGVTQLALAEKLNMKQNSLSQNMSRSRMSLGMFGRILNALGYDIVVVDRDSGEPMCKLYVETEEDPDDI